MTNEQCTVQAATDLFRTALPCAACGARGWLERLDAGDGAEACVTAASPDRIELTSPATFPPGTAVRFDCGQLLVMGEVAETFPFNGRLCTAIAISHILTEPRLDDSLKRGWSECTCRNDRI